MARQATRCWRTGRSSGARMPSARRAKPRRQYRPHAFRAAHQAATAIPPHAFRAGAWREIVLRFCANYISYYWICADFYWPLLRFALTLIGPYWICKKSFLQISGFRYFARSFLFNSQISSCKFRISASAKKPFLQILKFFSYARNCLSERHIKSSRQCRLRGTSSRPGNAARAAHTKSSRQYCPHGTSSRPGNTACAAHQVVPAIPPARHIKPPRQYRPRGTHKVVPAMPPARHINLPVRLQSAAPHQISTPAARMSSRLLRCTSAFAEDVQSDKTIVR